MPALDVEIILREADRLPYSRRGAMLAGRARELAASGGLDQALHRLGEGDRVRRDTALYLAIVTRHGATIEAALRDSDECIRGRALAAWVSGPDVTAAGLARLLDDAPAQTRVHLYRVLRRRRLAGLAGGVIDAVRGRFGDREAAALLPACDAATVRRLLPDLAHVVPNWATLAARHPGPVLADAERQLAALTPPARTTWWARCAEGVLRAASVLPAQVLDLLERYAPATSLPGDLRSYGRLAAADPQRVLRLLTAPARAAWLTRVVLPQALLRRFVPGESGLVVPDLTMLAIRLRASQASAFPAVLDAIPPRLRAGLFDAAWSDVDVRLAQWSDGILDALPHDRRAAEARRMLALGAIRADENLVLHYTAYLPWPEARQSLVDATRRATAEDRAFAYERLIRAAARTRDPAAVTEAVTYLTRIRNEQDPVRVRALTELARVSPMLLEPAVVDALTALVTAAVEARDASGQTVQVLGRLAVTLVRHHADSPQLLDCGLTTLRRLFGDGRLPSLGRLDTALRRGQELRVFAAVRDWIVAARRRGNHEPLFAFADGLGRRAWAIVELQDMLWTCVNRGNVAPVVSRAITLWLADPATRDRRVEEVLRWDTSTVTIHPVWTVVSRRRTDLLDLVLGGRAPKGKFLSKGPRWIPTGGGWVARWTSGQQRAYAELLAAAAADTGARVHSRTTAIRDAACVPDWGTPVVRRYLDAAETNLAEAALGALARTDRPAEAVSILLSHAGDDRARVAIYAATRAARFVRPSELAGPFTTVLAAGKVTSRKEIVRLLVGLGVAGAADILAAEWRREGQHPHVRAAIVSAARFRTDLSSAWPILTEAASGGREEVLGVLLADPFTVAEPDRVHYGELIVTACDSSDALVAQAAWAAAGRWAQWTPGIGAAAAVRMADLADRVVWRSVLAALVAMTASGLGRPAVADAVARLADLDAQSDTPESTDATGSDDRDRPARRRIEAAVSDLIRWSTSAASDVDRQAMAEAGRVLIGHPDLVEPGASLLLHAVPLSTVDDPDELVAFLAGVGDLLADRPVSAGRLAEELARLVSTDAAWRPEVLRGAASVLGARAGLAPALFALALARGGSRYRWSQPWRDLVLGLRGHSHPDVRAAALAVTLVRE